MNRSLATPLQLPRQVIDAIVRMPLARWNQIGVALTVTSGVVVAGTLLSQWWYATQISQHLPVSGVLHLGSTQVGLEVAHTETEKQIGLMNRDYLAADRGMAFLFNPPGRVGFWMHQVRFPLDLLFLDAENRIVALSESVPPCNRHCPVYYSPDHTPMVVELPGGSAQKFHLSVGQRVGLDVSQLPEFRIGRSP